MYPTNEKALIALGRSAADLLSDGPSWILRRKEKVTLLDETTVRRQMSVDYSLPVDAAPLRIWQGHEMWFAPLFFLQKGSDEEFDPEADLREPEPHFANFDFRDDRGRALSLPPRSWNAVVSGHMLSAVFRDALARHPDLDDPTLRTGLSAIAFNLCSSEQLRAVKLVDLLRKGSSVDNNGRQTAEENLLRQLEERDEPTRRMLDVCSISSVLMVPLVGPDARAGILKLSYDDQVATLSSERRPFRPYQAQLGLAGYELWIDTPFMGAATYHFEIQAPDGLEIYDAGLIRVGLRPLRAPGTPDKKPTLDRASGFASRVHLYEARSERSTKGLAWVRLRVRRQEFVGGAAVAGCLIAAVLWLALAGPVKDSPLNISTLLLLGPSLIAAYVVRPGPHRLTDRMLRAARWLVGVCAALPFVAAGALGLAKRDDQGRVEHASYAPWWFVLACVATALAVLLLAARVFPQPELVVTRWKKSLLQPAHPEPWIEHWREGRLGRIAASRPARALSKAWSAVRRRFIG